MERLLKKLPLLSIAAMLFLMQSCGGGDKTKTTTETKVEPAVAPAKQGTEAIAGGPFSVLKLKKDDLKYLFQNGQAGKLLIQFVDDGSPAMKAIVFNVKPNGIYDNIKITLEPAGTGADYTWDTTGVKILGNNELTKKQIKTLIGGTISVKATDLYFYPKKDANNQIFFVVSTTLSPMKKKNKDNVVITNYPPGDDTKPSPPAPPCSTCE